MDAETELVELCEKKITKFLKLQEVEAHEGGWAVFTSDSKEMKNSNGPLGNRNRDLPPQCLNQLRHCVHMPIFMYETFLTTIANTSTMRTLDVSFEKFNL